MALSNLNSPFKGEPNVLLAADADFLSSTTIKDAEKQKQLQILEDGYKRAKAEGTVTFAPPPSFSRLVNSQGKLQTTFLLPNGEKTGKYKGIGFPSPIIDQKLHDIRYSNEEGGYWLTFSALNEKNERNYAYVLFSETFRGEEAILRYYNASQKELSDHYIKALESEPVDFGTDGRPSSDLISTDGQLHMSFLLPKGEPIGRVTNIGFARHTTDPRLYEVKYSKEEGGFWLIFSALNEKGKRNYSHVLISENLSGKEAIIRYKTISQTQKELSDNYLKARKFGLIDFGINGRPSSDLIGHQGRLQESLLLPKGEQIGKHKRIGLQRPITDPRLHEIKYSDEEGGYWLTFSALNKNDILCFSKVLISETLSGEEAILKIVTDREDKNIPTAFKRSPPALPSQFRRNGKFTEKDLSSDFKKKDLSPTFPKGEAFEQIAGVLLASLYPDEKIIPASS